jgi:PAS domain S-box-containing protein
VRAAAPPSSGRGRGSRRGRAVRSSSLCLRRTGPNRVERPEPAGPSPPGRLRAGGTRRPIATWNPGGERIKGYTADEIIGRHFSVFFLPDDAAAGKPAALLERARREGRVRDEGWRVRKDGTRFWADVLITALVDDNGDLHGFAKLTRDETERRAAEEQTRLLERLAEREDLVQGLQHQVIKRIFGAGLTLNSALTLVHDPAVRDRLAAAIDERDATVREIRLSLFGHLGV